MKTVTLESINLKNNQTLNEKWLQAQIAENPAILGLGELHLRTREKIVSSGGRLDLLGCLSGGWETGTGWTKAGIRRILRDESGAGGCVSGLRAIWEWRG